MVNVILIIAICKHDDIYAEYRNLSVPRGLGTNVILDENVVVLFRI